jgi:4'-phosphopantetheinyl transferase
LDKSSLPMNTTMVAQRLERDRAPLRLDAREIHVWSIAIEPGSDAVPGLMALLSLSEQQRARRYIFESVQRRFIAARAALRVLVGSYLDMPAGTVSFAYGPSGKPHLTAPHDERLHFNLSHSNGLALFAFCATEDLGIDVEWLHEVTSAEQIVRRMFCPEEAAEWFSLPDEQRRRGFFDCWTRKEAFVKALGRGLEVPLDSFRVAFRPGELASVRWREDRQRETWSMFDVSPGGEYAAALAIRGRGWRVRRMVSDVFGASPTSV